MPLNHPAIRAPPVLNQTPVRIGFAVFAPFMASQKDCHEQGVYQLLPRLEETRSALQGVLATRRLAFLGKSKIWQRKYLKTRSSCESPAKGKPALTAGP
jgi:hypothetical protein